MNRKKKKLGGEIISAIPGLDDEDLRSGDDRRKFSYTACIPERRSGEDRRQDHHDNERKNSTTP